MARSVRASGAGIVGVYAVALLAAVSAAIVDGPEPAPVTTSQLANTAPAERALFAERDSSYQDIIVRDTTHAHIAALRAANPGARILVYKNLSFTGRESDGCPSAPFQGGGVSWCEADGHESWFLHDSAGNRIESDFPGLYAANIANPAYRRAWIDAVEARLNDIDNDGSDQRYDGVFIDDANLYPGHGMDGRMAELTDSAYSRAEQQFIDQVGDELGSKGFLTTANLGMNLFDPDQRSQAVEIAGHVSAVNRESFVRFGSGPLFTSPPSGELPDWSDQVTLEQEIQDAGAGFSAIVYGSANDIRAQRYARATFLLGWDGSAGSSLIFRPPPDPSGTSFLPGWTTDVGVPEGPMTAVGQGFRRYFTDGIVVVNPAAQGSQEFDLGASYRLPGGGCADSVALGPTRALVLSVCS